MGPPHYKLYTPNPKPLNPLKPQTTPDPKPQTLDCGGQGSTRVIPAGYGPTTLQWFLSQSCSVILAQGPCFKPLNPKSQALEPSSLNPQPSTCNTRHATLDMQPSTLNPQPSTLNPQHSTPKSQPSTLNPQSSTLSTLQHSAHSPKP